MDDFENRLGRFRPYLSLLARLQTPDLIRQKLDPSDLVQDVLMRAHSRSGQFLGTSDAEFAGWLRSILTNSIAESVRRFTGPQRDLNLERSLEAALELSSLRLEHMLAADLPSPDLAAEQKEDLIRLAAALETLPEDQRTAIELRHLKGLTVAEIGAQTDRSIAAVAGLLRRGLAQLRTTLLLPDDELPPE